MQETEYLSRRPSEILPTKAAEPRDFFALSDDTLSAMSDLDVIHVVIAARQLEARTQAIKLKAIARLDELRGGSRSVADELAPELRVTRQNAQTQVGVAQALQSRLPRLLRAMAAGELDEHKARQAVDATAPLSHTLAGRVDALVAQRIATKHASAWRACVNRAVRAVDPEGVRDRAAARRLDRKVSLVHEPDSMASLWAYLPAESASAIYGRVDTIAKKLKSRTEERTLDQLRADVLTDILLGERSNGVSAQVFVHVPITAALRMDDQGCELVGHGPIPADVARDLMAHPDSVLRKVVTDPVTGNVLDVGRKRYRPTDAISDLVRARDRTCRAPGCGRPAQYSERDHTHDWAKGGPTSASSMCCYCKHHHALKDEPGWNYHYQTETGELTVTTPAGRQHTTCPEPLTETPPPPF